MGRGGKDSLYKCFKLHYQDDSYANMNRIMRKPTFCINYANTEIVQIKIKLRFLKSSEHIKEKGIAHTAVSAT